MAPHLSTISIDMVRQGNISRPRSVALIFYRSLHLTDSSFFFLFFSIHNDKLLVESNVPLKQSFNMCLSKRTNKLRLIVFIPVRSANHKSDKDLDPRILDLKIDHFQCKELTVLKFEIYLIRREKFPFIIISFIQNQIKVKFPEQIYNSASYLSMILNNQRRFLLFLRIYFIGSYLQQTSRLFYHRKYQMHS